MEKQSSQGDNILYLYLFILSFSYEVSGSEADGFIYLENMLALGPHTPFSPKCDKMKATTLYRSETGKVPTAEKRNPGITDRGKVAQLSFLSS